MSIGEIQALRSAWLFRDLTDAELGEVLRLGKEVEFTAGEPITAAGMAAMDFYVIVEGDAELDVPGIRKDTLGPGSTFGELSVLDGGARSASIAAVSRVRALRIGREEFLALLDRQGSIGRKLLTEFATRLRRAEELARSATSG